MTRDEGIHLPVGKRLHSQESPLKYDADAVAAGPRANCWRRYCRERIASFVKDRSSETRFRGNVAASGTIKTFSSVV